MDKNIYISTTLPYANSVPHIGHALEFVQADALAKFNRQSVPVFFNVGIDENGLKVYTTAKNLGIDTQTYLDNLAEEWKHFCWQYQISYDNFYRTSSSRHHEKVQNFWLECLERGDLYKKKYSGHYCVGCESFKTDTDLVDGKCPDHGTVPIPYEEENWFFKASKYRDEWLQWLTEELAPYYLKPHNKLPELINLVKGQEDISVSRLKTNVPWGIEVPNDPDQVIYVWFEALLNYVFAVGESSYNDMYFIQLCGPDNLKFQGSLFPTILAGTDFMYAERLLVHGTVLDKDGNKMSKTKGNTVDPIQQLNMYGLDAIRYYMLAGFPTCNDTKWTEEDLVKLYNNDLANDFGNLLNRVLHLIEIKQIDILSEFEEDDFTRDVVAKNEQILNAWNKLDIYTALRLTNDLAKLGNKYITDKEPWKDGPEQTQVLNRLYHLLRFLQRRYVPVLSDETNIRIKSALVNVKKDIIFNKL